MPRQRTRLHYKILVDKIIDWLNANIDEWEDDKTKYVLDSEDQKAIVKKNAIADDSRDLKEKIDLYLEGQDEF